MALVERQRPDWEIPFADYNPSVLSVMPGESRKLFHDPLTHRDVLWEQDVYCPTCSILDGHIVCVYRAYGDDDQWRMGLGWSNDGIHFDLGDQPVFHARPENAFLGGLRDLGVAGISYGDSRLVAAEDGTYYLYFNYFSNGVVPRQELAVASTRDMVTWTMHGRIFARVADCDQGVIPEHAPWRFPHPGVVTRLQGDRLVAARLDGRYFMYLNCLSTVGRECLCAAVSDNLVDWEIVRDADGALVHPMPLRPGRFDSFYIDTAAAVLRDDGVLLIYNGINGGPEQQGDPALAMAAHYPAQALFAREEPARLLARSDTPFKGDDETLEKHPIVFWTAPLYEAWSLVPWHGELLLYWNHAFGRRSVGVWKAPIPATMRAEREETR